MAVGDREGILSAKLEAGSLLKGAEWEGLVAAQERKTGEQPSGRKIFDLKAERKNVCNLATNELGNTRNECPHESRQKLTHLDIVVL